MMQLLKHGLLALVGLKEKSNVLIAAPLISKPTLHITPCLTVAVKRNVQNGSAPEQEQ